MVECVVISVNYSDLLYYFLDKNLSKFDRTILVTSSRDIKTQELCQGRKNLDLIVSDCFYKNKEKFKRSEGINLAYENLKYKDWVCNIDSDCILQEPLNFNKLDIEKFYGARRVIIPEEEIKDLDTIINNRSKIDKYWKPEGYGYGYFQLFNWNSSTVQEKIKINGDRIYPNNYSGVGSADEIFRHYWGHLVDYKYPIGNIDEIFPEILHLGRVGLNEERMAL
jgi:hypothetical protein